MADTATLPVPGTSLELYPGAKVKLSRFSLETWVVDFGWYSWGGNRPVCGWYLIDAFCESRIKPLQLPDLDDIYFVGT